MESSRNVNTKLLYYATFPVLCDSDNTRRGSLKLQESQIMRISFVFKHYSFKRFECMSTLEHQFSCDSRNTVNEPRIFGKYHETESFS